MTPNPAPQSTCFLFPAHPLKRSTVDEMFADQLQALTAAGFATALCPDDTPQHGKPLRGIPANATVVYRGWMLTADEYTRLESAITSAGATAITSTNSYVAAHHLPNWYPLIPEFTPETRILPADADLEAELRALAWDAYFIKDYVKSVKTSLGSIIRDPAQIGAVVNEMLQFRGQIEGGFCIRRVEAFLPETERRYFILDGRAYAPDGDEPPEIVREVAKRIPSRFFSIDLIRRADGAMRVVEVGDGQVSDVVGWTAERFAEMWKDWAKANSI